MDRLPLVEEGSDDSAPPVAKRARIEPEGLDWASSFGKKDPAAATAGQSAGGSSSGGGGWSLRNWSQEKKAEPTPQAAVTEEEDWSFFQQQTESASTSTSTSSSSSSSSAPAPVASSFKVPRGRGDAKQRRVSFAEEVKVVTIPKVSKTMAGHHEDGDFDADGNPLYAEASIGDLEGGDLELEEEGEEMMLQQQDTGGGVASDAAPLRLSHSEEGVEGLIDYLLSSVPAQGKSSKSGAKYFGTSGAKGTSATQHEPSGRTAAAAAVPKRFDTKREDLDEDSFLEAFIDSSDDVAAAAAPTPDVATLPVEGGVVAKEKKAKKKPTFKF